MTVFIYTYLLYFKIAIHANLCKTVNPILMKFGKNIVYTPGSNISYFKKNQSQNVHEKGMNKCAKCTAQAN